MFWVHDGNVTVSLATMSCGRLFHSRAPATAKARSPVEQCDWRTSSWSVNDISDVVWTAYQTNSVDLQPGSEEPYRSVNDRRLSPGLEMSLERGVEMVESRRMSAGKWFHPGNCNRKGSQCEGSVIVRYIEFPFWAECRWDLPVSCDTDTTMSIKCRGPCPYTTVRIRVHTPCPQKHVTTFSTITLTISVRLQ